MTDNARKPRRGRPPQAPELCRNQRVVTFVTAAELAQLEKNGGSWEISALWRDLPVDPRESLCKNLQAGIIQI